MDPTGENPRWVTTAQDLAEWAEVARSLFPELIQFWEGPDGRLELRCGDLVPYKPHRVRRYE